MGGHWGGWHPAVNTTKNCNANEYVCGMNAKVDPSGQRDSAGITGVRIKCCKM